MNPLDAMEVGRQYAEDLMTSACTVERGTGGSTDAGGVWTPTTSAIYSGKCRVRPAGTQDRMVDTAGDDVGVVAFVVSLPITATDVRPGDVVVITTSPSDADSVGRRLVVLGAIHGSQITARRLGCSEAR